MIIWEYWEHDSGIQNRIAPIRTIKNKKILKIAYERKKSHHSEVYAEGAKGYDALAL